MEIGSVLILVAVIIILIATNYFSSKLVHMSRIKHEAELQIIA